MICRIATAVIQVGLLRVLLIAVGGLLGVFLYAVASLRIRMLEGPRAGHWLSLRGFLLRGVVRRFLITGFLGGALPYHIVYGLFTWLGVDISGQTEFLLFVLPYVGTFGVLYVRLCLKRATRARDQRPTGNSGEQYGK